MKNTKLLLLSFLTILSLTMVACTKDVGEEPYSSPVGRIGNPWDADGAGNHWFSVSPAKKVRFSRGNLQYQASTNTWRFAENQYDYIGDDNRYISASYYGWIDLFAWGTSGWNSQATVYQPYITDTNSTHYYPGGNPNNDLTGSYAQADWGIHNAISNGGNQPGMWRTLTSVEWNYLFSRSTSLYASATINNTHGFILLPDDFKKPNNVSFTPGGSSGWKTNYYNTYQWEKMEDAGAIFLPAAGIRVGNTIYEVGNLWIYWSSTHASEYRANYIFAYVGDIYVPSDGRSTGQSVRLVRVE